MKEAHTKEINRLCEKNFEEFVARRFSALEAQTTLYRECDTAITLLSLLMAERDSAKARCHEMSAVLRRILKAQKDMKDKPIDTLVKLCESFDQGRKVGLPTHLKALAEHRAKVTSETNEVKVKELELQTLPSLVNEAVRLREELKKVGTERLNFCVPLKKNRVEREETAAIRDQFTSLVSAASNAMEPKESDYATLRSKIIKLYFFTPVTRTAVVYTPH